MKLIKTTLVLSILLLSISLNSNAQKEAYQNTGDLLQVERNNRFQFGGYGQLDYNQQFSKDTRYNGKLDPHRFVLFVGYQFSKDIHLVSELEVEHGNELYLEQAFINYKINPMFQLRLGVMLTPMGLTNEYHEPTTFNGVERPSLSNIMIPTTWREMGAGFHGRIDNISLKYQAYVFTGFSGYDTEQRFNGKNGFRNGRQKAINSYISTPNLSAKVDFYGLENLNIGFAGYFGNSQSKLFDKMDKNSDLAQKKADSSVVAIAMVGLDIKYKIKGFELRGELIYTSVSNTEEYNKFNGKDIDLGSSMLGGYLEASYDIFNIMDMDNKKLTPFVRYENYNTHNATYGIKENKAYYMEEWIAGIGFQSVNGLVFKVDYQTRKTKADNAQREHFINGGVAFTF